MILAVKCKKCGQWRKQEFTNAYKTQFKCFSCPHKGTLRSTKGWNYTILPLRDNDFAEDIIREFNRRENEQT
jgi:hypothetical protein